MFTFKVKETERINQPLVMHTSPNIIDIETATLRQSDKIAYLSPFVFHNKFPYNKSIDEGAYGEVYLSGEDYAIKKFEEDSSLTELIRELNFYSTLIHPCIMKPLFWTVEDSVGYLAMNRGKDIWEAYANEYRISLSKILYDSLSAIAFMNSVGVAHADIKRKNMVYYKKKCMIIDMGFAVQGELHSDGEYYIDGAAYTWWDRDPEYFDGQYNSIKAEIWALGISMLSIQDNDYGAYRRLYSYPESKMNIEIKWFILEARKLLKDDKDPNNSRKTILKLLNIAREKYKFPPYVGTILEGPLERFEDVRVAILMEWLVEVAYTFNLKLETVFIALHLVHRTHPPFLRRKDVATIFQMYGCACLSLAITANRKERQIEWKYFKNISKATFAFSYENDFEEMNIEILKECGGIINTLTYWNYAKSKEDLFPLLSDLINSNYNPNLVREVVEGANKCVRMKEIMDAENFKKFIKTVNIRERYRKILNLSPRGRIQACKLDLSEDANKIKQIWKTRSYYDSDIAKLVGVVMHNRHVLNRLDAKLANLIFTTFYANEKDEGMIFILNTICNFDWKTTSDKYLKDQNAHPFGGEDYKEPINIITNNSAINNEAISSNLNQNKTSKKMADSNSSNESSDIKIVKQYTRPKEKFDSFKDETPDNSYKIHLPLMKGGSSPISPVDSI